jgi:hypothetical protein
MLTYHAVGVFLFGRTHHNDRHAQVDLLPLWRLTLELPVPSSFVSVETHCVSICTPISVRRATEFISTSPDPPWRAGRPHWVEFENEIVNEGAGYIVRVYSGTEVYTRRAAGRVRHNRKSNYRFGRCFPNTLFQKEPILGKATSSQYC